MLPPTGHPSENAALGFWEVIMLKNIFLSLGLVVFAQGVSIEFAHAQSVEVPPLIPVIQVTPISTGGSLVTIQTPIHIELPSIDTHRVSNDDLRSAIPNLRGDARVIEIKPTGKTGIPQVFIRENTDVWRKISPDTEPPPQPPVLWLTTAGSGKSYQLLTQLVPPESGQNSWGWPEVGPFAIHSAKDVASFAALFDYKPQMIIINHHGELLPDNWFHVIKNSGRPYVIVTPDSPNQDFLGAKTAAQLGDQPIHPNAVHIMSALPKLDGWISGYLELHRMNLSLGQRDAWEKLLSNIRSQTLPTPIHEASRESLQEELLNGNNDFVFVIAHNDGHFVYLPGSGGPISYDEIRRLQRSDAPNRTVVLVTCNGGTWNESARSLADIFLQNKLAKTVFASQTDVDANDVPDLLRDLLVRRAEIRSTLIKYGYFQFVMRLAWKNPNV
jgi:hypothetical protein